MVTRQRLKDILEQIPGVDLVQVIGNGSLVATVVSPSFEGQDEAERQVTVWSYLRGQLDEDDLQTIEFIFTNAPNETATGG